MFLYLNFFNLISIQNLQETIVSNPRTQFFFTGHSKFLDTGDRSDNLTTTNSIFVKTIHIFKFLL